MESITEERVKYAVYTRVLKVEKLSRGWFVQFEGSWESLNFGPVRPHLYVGERVKITFEHVNDKV